MHEMNFRGHWKTIRLEEIADVRAGIMKVRELIKLIEDDGWYRLDYIKT